MAVVEFKIAAAVLRTASRSGYNVFGKPVFRARLRRYATRARARLPRCTTVMGVVRRASVELLFRAALLYFIPPLVARFKNDRNLKFCLVVCGSKVTLSIASRQSFINRKAAFLLPQGGALKTRVCSATLWRAKLRRFESCANFSHRNVDLRARV